jgi:hypothetical protein
MEPTQAAIVREAFELYAGGGESLDTLREFFTQHGVRTKTNRVVGRSFVSRLLSNPIYYGHFRWGGDLHEGVHEPIISKTVFDAAQRILSGRFRYSPARVTRISKPFTGLLRCGECGCAITAEIQKTHVYYRCSKKNRSLPPCSQRYLREESLDIQISRLLTRYQLPEGWAAHMLARLETERCQAAQSAEIVLNEKRAELRKRENRVERLKNALLDGLIVGDEYRAEKSKILSEKRCIEETVAALMSGPRNWLEPFKTWISEAQNLSQVATQASLTQKRDMARKIFGSNLVVKGQRVRGRAENPWSLIAGGYTGITIAHLFDAARTFFQEAAAKQGLETTSSRSSVQALGFEPSSHRESNRDKL